MFLTVQEPVQAISVSLTDFNQPCNFARRMRKTAICLVDCRLLHACCKHMTMTVFVPFAFLSCMRCSDERGLFMGGGFDLTAVTTSRTL